MLAKGGYRVNGLGTLAVVAVPACGNEVGHLIRPTLRPRHDVIDFQRHPVGRATTAVATTEPITGKDIEAQSDCYLDRPPCTVEPQRTPPFLHQRDEIDLSLWLPSRPRALWPEAAFTTIPREGRTDLARMAAGRQPTCPDDSVMQPRAALAVHARQVARCAELRLATLAEVADVAVKVICLGDQLVTRRTANFVHYSRHRPSIFPGSRSRSPSWYS